MLCELLFDAILVRRREVNLVNRDDNRYFGGKRVVDGLDGLRHHSVVCRDHQDGDVGHLGAPRAHRGERGVARRIDEGDELAIALHLVGPDVLGDAPASPAATFVLRMASRRLVLPWST